VSVAFCPKCGTGRTGSFRFCRSCGLDFDTLSNVAASAPPPAQPGWSAIPAATTLAAPSGAPAMADVGTYRLLTMLAWLGSALCLGWLALIQIGFAGTILDNGTFTALAAWNAVVAAIMVYGAVRLNRSTRRSSFRQSAIWAVVIIVLQGFQIAEGATHIAYVLATVAAAGAGILAWLTYGAMPAETPPA
jgi:hypothetical protein